MLQAPDFLLRNSKALFLIQRRVTLQIYAHSFIPCLFSYIYSEYVCKYPEDPVPSVIAISRVYLCWEWSVGKAGSSSAKSIFSLQYQTPENARTLIYSIFLFRLHNRCVFTMAVKICIDTVAVRYCRFSRKDKQNVEKD